MFLLKIQSPILSKVHKFPSHLQSQLLLHLFKNQSEVGSSTINHHSNHLANQEWRASETLKEVQHEVELKNNSLLNYASPWQMNTSVHSEDLLDQEHCQLINSHNTWTLNYYPSRREKIEFCNKWNISDSILENALTLLRKMVRANKINVSHEMSNDTKRLLMENTTLDLKSSNPEGVTSISDNKIDTSTIMDTETNENSLESQWTSHLFLGKVSIPQWKREYVWERIDALHKDAHVLNQVQKHLELSKRMIKSIMNEKQFPRGDITLEKKEQLRKMYLEVHQNDQQLLKEVVPELKSTLGEEVTQQIKRKFHSEGDYYEIWAQQLNLNVSQVRGLIKSFRDGIRGDFTDEKKSVLNGVLQARTPVTRQKIKQLSKELELSKSQIYSYLWKRMHSNRNVLPNHITYLKDWIQQHRKDLSDPSSRNDFIKEHIQDLLQKTNLGRVQIHQYIQYYTQVPGTITDEARNIIYNVLQSQKMCLLPSDEIRKLASKTQLNTNQVKYIIRTFLDPKGHSTPHKKQLIRNSLYKLQRAPTRQDITLWKKQTHLSTQQIRSILYSLSKKRKINESDHKYLRNWIEIHKRPPLKAERRKIRQVLGLTPTQMKYLVESELDQPGKLTFSKKCAIIQWLQDNQRTTLPKNIREDFKKSLQLSSSQISAIIYSYIHGSGKFTETSKSICEEWLKRHNRLPTYNETSVLMEQTGLNRVQVREFIRRRYEKGEITESNKKIILEFAEGKPLTSNLLQSIQDETKLSRKQIKEILKRHSFPLGQVTKEKKSQILSWLNLNNDTPSFNDLCTLSKELSLSPFQIKQQIQQIRNNHHKLTPSKKELLLQWIQKYQGRKPTQEDMKSIAIDIELSYRQVYDFCRRHLHRFQ